MAEQHGRGILLRGLDTLPIQIPQEILDAQGHLGLDATILWINLLAFAQKGEPVQISLIAEYMSIDESRLQKALVVLADHGWINDEGLEIRLIVPKQVVPTEKPAVKNILDEEQASFEWLVTFWTNRVGAPSTADMRKLLFWVEKKGVSPEVIAVAIEEMCGASKTTSFAYVEGILRNWYNEGIRSYSDLVDKAHLARVLNNPPECAIHPEAKKKWKEVFPDEFS